MSSTTKEDTLAMLAKAKDRKGWDERTKYFSTRRVVQVMIVLAIIAWLVLLGWILFVAVITKAEVKALAVGADLSIILAPIIAAAAGVERMLETIFNVVEGSWKTLVAYLGYGFRWLKSAEVEVSEARQWLSHTAAIYNSTSAQYNTQMTALMKLGTDPENPQLTVTSLPPELSQKMGVLAEEAARKTEQVKQLMVAAQERLSAAESKLGGITDSEGYKGAKGAVAIMLGLMLGIIVAAVGQLQMFALLGIGLVPATIDVLITGLVIGSGSYPVHSLVGILQQGKNALDGLQGYLNNATPGSAKNPPTGQATSFPTASPGPVAPFAATPAQAVAVESSAAITDATAQPLAPSSGVPGPLG